MQLSEIQQQTLQRSASPTPAWQSEQDSLPQRAARASISFIVATAQVENAATLLQASRMFCC